MKELELLEEMKRKMISNISNKEDIPEETIAIIKNAFDGLEQIYEEMNYNNPSIQEYLRGSFEQIKSDVTKEIGENRKDKQFEQVQYMLKEIERNVLEGIEEEQRPRTEENILSLENESSKNTTRILEYIEDALADVQSRQNSILNARGYSKEQIYEIQDQAKRFILQFQNRNDERIYETLGQDDNKFKKQFLDEYELFVQQCEKTKTKEKSFKEEIADYEGKQSLEEQRKFSEEIMNRKKEEEKQGPETTLDCDIII